MSDAPTDEVLYGLEFFTTDIISVLDEADIAKAHVVGLSMGAEGGGGSGGLRRTRPEDQRLTGAWGTLQAAR